MESEVSLKRESRDGYRVSFEGRYVLILLIFITIYADDEGSGYRVLGTYPFQTL